MNRYIARILYHTHDKHFLQVEVKYRDDLIKFLEFMIIRNRSQTETILKKILEKVDKGDEVLTSKGILNVFNIEMPDIMKDYFIVYESNLKKFTKD